MPVFTNGVQMNKLSYDNLKQAAYINWLVIMTAITIHFKIVYNYA